MKIGQKTSMLRCLDFSHKSKRGNVYKFVCDCGKECLILGYKVNIGEKKSCGCLQKIKTTEANKTHGLSRTPEYNIWKAMINRCYDKKNKSYLRYGARGITVCDRWLSSFENFLQDMGKRPSPNLQIDRIDNNGNYEPNNCRWIPHITNSQNRSTSIFIEVNGQRATISEHCRRFGISKSKIYYRLKRGISIDDCFKQLEEN
jgi:hypothetical protein